MEIIDTAERALARTLANPLSPYAQAVMAAQSESVEKPEPKPDEKVRTLMSELSAVQDELDAAADAARRGDAEASAVNLPALASRIAALQRELSAARDEEAEAERKREADEQRGFEKTFTESVERARRDREDIRGLFRQLAVALGSYCSAVEAACNARNALSTFLRDPVCDLELSDVSDRSALSPLNELLDSGLKPVFGDLSLNIPPLIGQKE